MHIASPCIYLEAVHSGETHISNFHQQRRDQCRIFGDVKKPVPVILIGRYIYTYERKTGERHVLHADADKLQ